MITIIDPGRYFHVSDDDARILSDDLHTAVELAHNHAAREGWQGVKIRRHHGTGSYAVALCADVPFGYAESCTN